MVVDRRRMISLAQVVRRRTISLARVVRRRMISQVQVVVTRLMTFQNGGKMSRMKWVPVMTPSRSVINVPHRRWEDLHVIMKPRHASSGVRSVALLNTQRRNVTAVVAWMVERPLAIGLAPRTLVRQLLLPTINVLRSKQPMRMVVSGFVLTLSQGPQDYIQQI